MMMNDVLPLLIEEYSDLADQALKSAAQDREIRETEIGTYTKVRLTIKLSSVVALPDLVLSAYDIAILTSRAKLHDVQTGGPTRETLVSVDESLREAAIGCIRQLELAEDVALTERIEMLEERRKKQKIM